MITKTVILSSLLFYLFILNYAFTITINDAVDQPTIQVEVNTASAGNTPLEVVFTDSSSSGSNSASNGGTIIVSCLGNSLTQGYPYVGTGNTYPAQMQAMLDTAFGSGTFQMINHGISGYRADQVLTALQDSSWMTIDNPDYVLLIVGGNDLYQGQTIASTVADVQSIIDTVTAHTNPDGSHPKIIVSAMIPNMLFPPYGSAYISLYNTSLASNLTGMYLWFTDNWDDFYDPDLGSANPSLMYDNVHPNIDGYYVMAENWFGAVRHPLISSPDSLGLDFGIVYLSDISEDSVIVIENVGTDTVFVSGLSFVNSTGGFNYTYANLGNPILPTASDTILVNFEPQVAQTYIDTLIITNNSENNPNLKIPLYGIGEYIPPAAPTGVQITISYDDVVISWTGVDTTIYGTPITVDYYVVYKSSNPYGEYALLDTTSNTTYIHYGGASSNEKMFYVVRSFVDSFDKPNNFIDNNQAKKFRY